MKRKRHSSLMRLVPDRRPNADTAGVEQSPTASPVKLIPLIIGLALAIAVTLTSGLLHGRMSQRWGMDARMARVAERLEMFPEQIGPWQLEGSYELGASAMELLDCQGYVHRGYRHVETGDLVKLSVMVGPGSKMSIHVPEICFEASNFTLLGPRQRFPVSVKGHEHALWSVQFQVNDVSERKVRVLYGWSTGSEWIAPRMPRWSVAAAPVLFKMQVSHVLNDIAPNQTAHADRLLEELLRDTIAVLHDLIQEPTGSTAMAETP